MAPNDYSRCRIRRDGFIAPLEAGVPLLEALQLYITGPHRTYVLDTTAAPRLHCLDVTGDFLFRIPAESSIQQFTLKSGATMWTSPPKSWSSENSPFRLFPTMKNLKIVDIDVYETEHVPPKLKVAVISLQELSLSFAKETVVTMGSLLDKLTLSSLQTLSIDLYHGKEIPFLGIQSLIDRSDARLTSLSLYGRRIGQVISEDELINCILHLPHLKSLFLRRIPTTDAFLTALSTPSSPPNSDQLPLLCPVLDHLTFSGANFSKQAVIDMINYRRNQTNHPLGSANFFACILSPSRHAPWTPFRKKAKKMGMGLYVTDYDYYG